MSKSARGKAQKQDASVRRDVGTPTFIFFIEEVWQVPEGGGLAVSGRMVEGYFPGPCGGRARLPDQTVVPVQVLGIARPRTSRLEGAFTLRIAVKEVHPLQLQGALLFGLRSTNDGGH